MPTPGYILDLRRHYGQGRLLLPGVSGVVLRDDLTPGVRHVLLVRRSDDGRWTLPAGIVEPGEQPATTMVRELLEETRIVATAERLVLLTADPDLVYPNGDRCQYVSMTFLCRYVSGEAAVGDEESTEVAWMPVGALPDGFDPLFQRRIEVALADEPTCVFDL